jgi:hypothetical protein
MGKLVSGIFGMDSGTKQSGAGIEAGERYAKDIIFKPVTIASTLASMTGSPEGEYSGAMQPELLGIRGAALGGAENLYKTLSQFDVGSVANQLYQQEYEMLKPTLAAQQTQMQERMFGTGRLGLKLAGEGVGAGAAAGMVSPDAFGLGQAQSQMLGQLALGARERAYQEAMQTGQLASGMLGSAMGIEEMAQKLIALGIEAQSARSAAAAAAGQVGTSGYNMATQAAMNQDTAMGSFWGGLFGGVGTAMSKSDISLKEDIKLLGKLPNGINWYSWSWNNIAKKLGIDKQPTTGVLAQEIQKIIPDAVKVDPADGYLMVDYSKILEA